MIGFATMHDWIEIVQKTNPNFQLLTVVTFAIPQRRSRPATLLLPNSLALHVSL